LACFLFIEGIDMLLSHILQHLPIYHSIQPVLKPLVEVPCPIKNNHTYTTFPSFHPTVLFLLTSCPLSSLIPSTVPSSSFYVARSPPHSAHLITAIHYPYCKTLSPLHPSNHRPTPPLLLPSSLNPSAKADSQPAFQPNHKRYPLHQLIPQNHC